MVALFVVAWVAATVSAVGFGTALARGERDGVVILGLTTLVGLSLTIALGCEVAS